MRYLQITCILVTVIPGWMPVSEGVSASELNSCIVQGHIEILNPQARRPGGGADAGGVVVWLVPSTETVNLENPNPVRRKIDQRDKRFVPHVLAIQVGTEVDFPNLDPFFHNVFSVYDGKTFDLGLYANGESRPVRFNRPGISYIYCNIHPQMSAIVVSVETPFFTLSEPDGDFIIRDVPMGEYRFHLWHERCDAQQLSAKSRVVAANSAVTELGVIRLDEAGYITKAHKDKHGEDYDRERRFPPYRQP